MASIPTTTTLLFPLFLSFFLFAQATLNLDPSDHDALMIIQRGLQGINLHHQTNSLSQRNPCNRHGVICERRVSNYSSTLKITHLHFESQLLGGSVSPAIGRLSELRELSLGNNHLIDRLPRQIVDCRKLKVLNLKNNQFSGDVPPELSKLVQLRVLDLSSNRFSGDLSFLMYFPNLEVLLLSDNLFTGKVPASLRSFQNLRLFDISGNEYIQGPFPVLNEARAEYGSAEIVRKNNIVPRRFMLAENTNSRRNQTSAAAAAPRASSILGPAPAPAPAPAPSPSVAAHHHHHHKKRKLGAWLLGFLAGAVIGGFSGIIVSAIIKMLIVLVRGGENDSGITIFSPLIKKEEDLAFLEKEDGLATAELIGRGGCGEVYRAQLPGEDGKMIAIKKISEPRKEAGELAEEETKLLNKKMRQIKSEIKTVGQIRHRNLLPLLAHVSGPNCHYLVYEFMKNGSLHDVMNRVAEGVGELDWPARHRIALGIACGLEYLHFNNQPKIIHRDLKPANILLDDDMEPRITDFGLAKAMPDAQTHITSSNVAGTLGYIAPEYHQTLKFTDKCDIYSYGVLLGGLMMGKLPTDQFFQETEEVNLVKWMRNVMTSEDPTRAIDEKLLGNGFEAQMLQVLKIACFCTLDDPKQRPNSKDVGRMLSQIKPL
ncbi:Leucine-rich repeat receptor-like serine/threonine/tyrosine-protein kinase sobir1 [Dionaea muscipula]